MNVATIVTIIAVISVSSSVCTRSLGQRVCIMWGNVDQVQVDCIKMYEGSRAFDFFPFQSFVVAISGLPIVMVINARIFRNWRNFYT